MKFIRLSAIPLSKAEDLGAPGDRPGLCITTCMSRLKSPALNRDHCFCLDIGDLTQLEESFSEDADVLTVLDATRYLPKAPGKWSTVHCCTSCAL